MERLIPPLPIALGAMLIAGWIVWRRHDPEMGASWQPITVIVVRQLMRITEMGVSSCRPNGRADAG